MRRSFHQYRNSIITGVVIGLALALSFIAGFFVRDLFPAVAVNRLSLDSISNVPDDYPLIGEVELLLSQVFLREIPDATTRQYGAVKGILGTLGDPNTFFIEPPVAQSEADVLAGTYGGIGVILRRAEDGSFHLYPFDDSPAKAAGIEDGDRLTAINGEEILVDEQQDAVDQKLRGEVKEGSGVEITVLRQEDEELTVFIEFAVINVPSVVWRVTEEDSRIGYVQILRFTNRTPDELEEAFGELNEYDIESLILDLRGNTGGLLLESIEVASQFLDGGVVAIEVSRDDREVFEAEEDGLADQIPLVVIVNNRTASASEIVAGAIQARERGTLIGQTTFGKGTVQQIFSLSDGSSVHITSAEWLTPTEEPIDGVGLEPDIAMIPDENGRDVEFGESIRYLQGMLDTEESTETNDE